MFSNNITYFEYYLYVYYITMTEYKEIVSWTGRRDPISGKRDKTFTVDQNKFTNIEDARKAKRQANLDPFKDTPLPNIYKGPVPIKSLIVCLTK